MRPARAFYQSLLAACLMSLLAVVTAAPHVLAQSDAPPSSASIADELARRRTTITLENGELGGDGAKLLLDEAKASEFMLVGEDHGLAEMPRFTAALFRLIAPAGYRHLAVEAGPITGRYVTKMAAGAEPQRAFADFNRAYPFALPFYTWREEAEMLESVARTAKGVDDPFWALDQEFILSAPIHFDRLVEIAPDAKARAVATEYRDKAKTEFARMVESKNPGVVFMASATADDFKRLDEAFHAAPDSEAGRILRELEVSWEIYQKNFTSQGYASNAQRIDLMKAHFRDFYDRALEAEKAPPKALFKFGAFHMPRGRSVVNCFDLGNLASELATINGSRSFHLFVVAAGGTQNAFRPFGSDVADKRKPYDAVAELDFMDIKPLLAAAAKDTWTLFDLRPLRPLVAGRKFGQMNRGLEDAIYGYDAILVIPSAHAATLFE